jgi:hypothetical protein
MAKHIRHGNSVNAKAIAAAISAALSALLLVVNGNETFANVTTAEWLSVVLAVVGTTGVVYAVPNGPKEPTEVVLLDEPVQVHEVEDEAEVGLDQDGIRG